jgi:acyl-CoA thioesterase-1
MIGSAVTEAFMSSLRILLFGAVLAGLALGGGGAGAATILVLGDSLTAGHGLDGRDAFPSRLEAALRDVALDVRVINGGVSGDTTAGGLARLDWSMRDKPDLVIVELGANDALRGLDPAATYRNLDRIVARIRARGARVLLAGMRAPPNMGAEYGNEFNAVFPELARQHNIAFYPFFLDGVAGIPALNLDDGMHPNARGVAVIVERMLPAVRAALSGD